MKKRLLTVLLCAVLLIGTVFSVSVNTAAAELFGDVDDNGRVEAVDVTLIQRYLVGTKMLDEAAQKRGTVSGNDEVSIIDATLIQRYLSKLIKSFPAEEAASDTVTIRFTDNKKWGTVNAYLYNYASGEELCAWPGTEMAVSGTDSDGKPIYKMDVNVGKFDRVIFNNGDTKQTTATPVTKANSGYYLNTRTGSKYIAGIYPYEDVGAGKIVTKKLTYPKGYDKTIYIWTPEGYDPADTDKKYSVLYMSDGHNIMDKMHSYAGVEWQCDESILTLMSHGGDGIILVGIDNNDSERTTELTPNIGEMSPENIAAMGDEDIPFEGDVFAGFVVKDLIPYIDSHYNTNDVRGFAGSSCGGQEAFYIGMEYPETFDYIGAFSSAFSYFTDEAWENYLNTKDFSGEVPRLYLYTGANAKDSTESWIRVSAVKMGGWLLDHGYPADKLYNVVDPDGVHHERYWSLYFPELLCWGLDV